MLNKSNTQRRLERLETKAEEIGKQKVNEFATLALDGIRAAYASLDQATGDQVFRMMQENWREPPPQSVSDEQTCLRSWISRSGLLDLMNEVHKKAVMPVQQVLTDPAEVQRIDVARIVPRDVVLHLPAGQLGPQALHVCLDLLLSRQEHADRLLG